MPLYTFENPDNGEIQDIFFHMDDDKTYIDGDGLTWKRVLMSPQLNTISSIDPWNNNDFVNKTAEMKGTVGDMLDKSAELSEKRAEGHGGVDPVKKEFFKNYSKERKGAKHPSEKGKSYESKNVKIDFD
tara:strand:- start:99 stop:485 length:387 start_codon:yes stop_codon:yes gene_type:complete